jgi:hypothetical protein
MLGIATMNPMVATSFLDITRYRVVCYADTPYTLESYRLATKIPDPARKMVCFLFGAAHLPKVIPDRTKFASIVIFDDMQNLRTVAHKIPGFQVLDVEARTDGLQYKRQITPQELMAAVDADKVPVDVPFLTHVTNALGRRKPTVLETTSRVPHPEGVADSGVCRILQEAREYLVDDSVTYQVIQDTFARYLFGMMERSAVTQRVTKRLPAEAKDLWKQALDFADSDVGARLCACYRALCRTQDPDYRAGFAAKEHNIQAYAGDLLYFCALIPPSSEHQFLDGGNDEATESTKPLINVSKPKAKVGKPVVRKGRKPEARA